MTKTLDNSTCLSTLDEPLVECSEIPVHGVLAYENIDTGDNRRFDLEALTYRDLPIPLRLEHTGNHGGTHSEAVVVGVVDTIIREKINGNTAKLNYTGRILVNKPYADLALEGIVDGSCCGVSIDADSASDYSNDFDLESEVLSYSKARISALTIVPIPAFADAYISLGKDENDVKIIDDLDELGDEETEKLPNNITKLETSINNAMLHLVLLQAFKRKVPAGWSNKDWDGSSSRFTNEQWKRSCLVDHGKEHDTIKERYGLPVREPDGKVNVHAVYNATSRLNQVKDATPEAIASAKSKLRGFYKELGVEPKDLPDAIKASLGVKAIPTPLEVFGDNTDTYAPGTHDGPGWITHPVPTARIRRYWVRGKGALKIRWGISGDFNRCRRQLVKYVQNPRWLAGLCANMHKEATGLWPGRHHHHSIQKLLQAGIKASSALRIVSNTDTVIYKYDNFSNPRFTEPTNLTITQEGRIYGHLALWGSCHVGFNNECVTPPKTSTRYAYFKTGTLTTENGLINVGKLSCGQKHADDSCNIVQATAHYDDPSSVVAYVNVGEDKFGIWYSGELAKTASADKVTQLQNLGSISGDWRRIGNNFDLVGIIGVVSAGYPIPSSLVASAGITTATDKIIVSRAIDTKLNNKETIAGIAKHIYNLIEKEKKLKQIKDYNYKLKLNKVKSYSTT